MGFTNQFQCLCLALIIVLGAWVPQAMARTLQDASMHERHEQWMYLHGRVYNDNYEKEKRYQIFKENVERIESFNKADNKSYKLGVNEFADLTNEEFKASRNRFKGHMGSQSELISYKYENVTAVPPTMDWRMRGAVTPVKNQGQCVAALEGITQLRTGILVSLSEQELVDCDRNGVDQGCRGGLMDEAFKFILQNKGLTTEANYPFNGVDGTCNAIMEANSAAYITGFEDVPANNEEALLYAVANQPVSVAIDAGSHEFQFYSSGVFTGPCGTNLDHGVAAVGYGVDADGTKYWLVKNSWSTRWGEGGYIRMQRDVVAMEGLCGIAMQPSYPTA
ncbi:hypothetical protein JRO89_XS01G0197700 [Xanthoceras sorbifolium]|uniref:Uncharacterized protein n=1 Tax=Xanthoceras sorbifolium TaxID=99658 RepID=A0ABQ8IK46_9ROSI|nr:hypothetical protein JRO89_XS01G0197700 [Xanthoceras sorbifolium]